MHLSLYYGIENACVKPDNILYRRGPSGAPILQIIDCCLPLIVIYYVIVFGDNIVMAHFTNKNYELLVEELMGDTFYIDTSLRGKIKGIRQYTEVIVRKILDIPSNKSMSLGKDNIKNQIKNCLTMNILKVRWTLFE